MDDLGLRGASSLVAFSGGGDSMALAVAAGEARRSRRLRPWLAHVEHRVRTDAEGDPMVVLRAAEHLHLPLAIRVVPDGAIANHRGSGVEEAMRRERYLLLASVADAVGADTVMTAHHADDQAETVLGHLIRGCGLDGAAGMRRRSTLPIPWWPSDVAARELVVVRPLLSERRVDLPDLAKTAGVETIDDASNRDVDRTRSALRHQVLPILERIQPGASVALSRFAELAQDVASSDEGLAEADGMGVGHRLDVADVVGTLASRRRLIRAWVCDQVGLTLSFERVEAIRRWAPTGSGCVEVGGGCSIRRVGGQLELTRTDRGEGRSTTWEPKTPVSPGS